LFLFPATAIVIVRDRGDDNGAAAGHRERSAQDQLVPRLSI
jgi:hypothetical protein